VVGPGGRIGEREGGLLDLLIRPGEPSGVLAQMLLPRRHPEDLDEAVLVLGVAVSSQLLAPVCRRVDCRASIATRKSGSRLAATV
jgi:hypothetical protein